jgi:hypothetical protein
MASEARATEAEGFGGSVATALGSQGGKFQCTIFFFFMQGGDTLCGEIWRQILLRGILAR